MMIKSRGIWLFGLAGSGKTYASKIFNQELYNSFIIDGHEVRKNINFDLGYSLLDRELGLKRLLGISKIVLRNDLYPICCSVLMTNKIFEKCKNENIKVIQIDRSFDELEKIRKIYQFDKNVVGKDIKQPQIETAKIFNNGTLEFNGLIKKQISKL